MRWKKKEYWPVDSGVKLFISVILGIIPFFIYNQISFLLLVGYLLLLTLFYGASLREMMKSMGAYVIIIIIPYVFGLLMAAIVSFATGTEMTMVYSSYQDVARRLIELLLLWYATSMYFFSTPTEEVVGVFNKVLSPLKRLGVPVTDFLTVVMCVVKELKNLGPGVKKSFKEGMGQLSKESSLRSKIKVSSNVLVSFIVDSFQRLDEVEGYVMQVDSKDLFTYKCSISKTEVLQMLIFVLLIGSIVVMEARVV